MSKADVTYGCDCEL